VVYVGLVVVHVVVVMLFVQSGLIPLFNIIDSSFV
jgi:hypothetical protein